ncbi:hypothetical protein DFP73DRAFT_594029 [Morchella snyderi]|nr:hypothetical protein DFP73DRAFT_594029 [Morchella snyderi]
MEDDSISPPWSLIPKSDNEDCVHLANSDLKKLRKWHKDKKLYIAESQFGASRVVCIDNCLPNLKTLSERRFEEFLREMWCGLVQKYVSMWQVREKEYQTCLKRQPALLQRVAAMDKQLMENLIVEYTAEEDILINYMLTYETPLLPEGFAYEEYRKLRSRVDKRLKTLETWIQELKNEIKTGQTLKDCIEYEREFGQGAKDFVMIWILNRALVFILTLQ